MDLLCLLMLPVLLLIDGAYSFWQLNKLYQRYVFWIRGNTTVNIARDRSALHKLIAHAGISERVVPRLHHLGYGRAYQVELGVIDQFPSNDPEMVEASTLLIQFALGVYRDRMKNAFNPLWWLDTLIFLPRAVLTYLNISAESIIVRVGQLAWWAGGLLLVAYKTEILHQIRNVIAYLFGSSSP